MTQSEDTARMNKLWPRSTTILLLLVGAVLSVCSFAAVLAMGEATWHPARDAELRATYETYQQTGVLLIKPTGSGSYGAQAPSPGPLAAATWDDDPGSYIVASLMSHITGSESPYPGLGLAQGLLVALPLLWLPMAVARTFRSSRAGYAIILLPLVLWIINHGAVLVGTEYGLSDEVSTLRVYAVYGIAASLAFLSLSLLLLLATFRMRPGVLIAASLGFGVLAGFGNLSRSLSGMGIALCVGVLWWLNVPKRWRLVAGALASISVVALALLVQAGVMGAINVTRVEATKQTIEQLPDAHALWHSMYMGLAYPQAIGGPPSRFDVKWSDEYGWEKAREIDPEVIVASQDYDDILKGLYWEQVSSDPLGAVKLYVLKALYLLKHFGAMVLFVTVSFALGLWQRGRHRKPLGVALAIGLPTLVLGLAPPVLVMPMLYYYSELSAALGLLAAVAWGGLVWALSSLPSRVRIAERKRLTGRLLSAPTTTPATISVVTVVRAEGDAFEGWSGVVPSESPHGGEMILVGGEPSSPIERRPDEVPTEEQGARVIALPAEGRLGDALRVGTLASSGRRLLLIPDPSAVGQAELQRFIQMPYDAGIEIGIHVLDPQVELGARARLVRFFREAFLPEGVPDRPALVLVDGDWARAFAAISRENGSLWITELAVAAAQQNIELRVYPLNAKVREKILAAEPSVWRSFIGFVRVSFHKGEYVNAPDASASSSSLLP